MSASQDLDENNIDHVDDERNGDHNQRAGGRRRAGSPLHRTPSVWVQQQGPPLVQITLPIFGSPAAGQQPGPLRQGQNTQQENRNVPSDGHVFSGHSRHQLNSTRNSPWAIFTLERLERLFDDLQLRHPPVRTMFDYCDVLDGIQGISPSMLINQRMAGSDSSGGPVVTTPSKEIFWAQAQARDEQSSGGCGRPGETAEQKYGLTGSLSGQKSAPCNGTVIIVTYEGLTKAICVCKLAVERAKGEVDEIVSDMERYQDKRKDKQLKGATMSFAGAILASGGLFLTAGVPAVAARVVGTAASVTSAVMDTRIKKQDAKVAQEFVRDVAQPVKSFNSSQSTLQEKLAEAIRMNVELPSGVTHLETFQELVEKMTRQSGKSYISEAKPFVFSAGCIYEQLLQAITFVQRNGLEKCPRSIIGLLDLARKEFPSLAEVLKCAGTIASASDPGVYTIVLNGIGKVVVAVGLLTVVANTIQVFNDARKDNPNPCLKEARRIRNVMQQRKEELDLAYTDMDNWKNAFKRSHKTCCC